MDLKLIHTLKGGDCSDSSCPTVYATDRDTYVIQGFILENAEKDKLGLPGNEDAVEVPASFIKALMEKI